MLLFSCGQCGTSGTDIKLRRCARCHFQTYCGENCQKAHWSLHKLNCKVVEKPQDLSVQKSSIADLDCKAISTLLIGMVQSIRAPEDIITDVELNADTSLEGDMLKMYNKYKTRYVDRCKLDLQILMVRQACHQASSQLGGTHKVSIDIAVTKFGVGICREKSSVVLYNLAMQDLKGHVLQMINPRESVHTHGFIVMGISDMALSSIADNSNFSLERLMASEKLYIIDPLLKWHGPSSEYIVSPLYKYNQTLGISALLEYSAQPAQSEIEAILRESEAVYQSAKEILPTVNPNSFPISSFLKFLGVSSEFGL